MTDWTAGYVADIGYTYGYYPELNPLLARLGFLNAGLHCPEFGAACELGFGQGVSTNIHAAASVTKWSGTDFNPAQAGFAQELATVAQSGARLFDQAFDKFGARDDLPEFDYIGLHGIWSWISDENRAVIVEFIRKKLKVGGVLYVSYNTQPGWAAMVPMRALLTEHCDVMGAKGQGIVPRIDGALAFAEKLLSTNPGYAKANPAIAERVKKMKGQPRNYLAHEYFNRDWHPMGFADMARWLAPAKLEFACSARYLDSVDAINLSADQQAFLREIPDAMFRQTVRDFMVNQAFRKDYWVKGVRTLSPLERAEGLRAQSVVLTTPRADVTLKVTTTLGEAAMNEAVYAPMLDALANHQPKTIAQLEQAVKDKGVNYTQTIEAVMILIGAGYLAAVQDETTIAQAKEHTDKLNAHLMRKARDGGDIAHLASPLTGGGVAVGRFIQLFVLAISEGKTQPAEWAQFAWTVLAEQGQRLLKDGAPMEAPEDNLAELTRQAQEFADKQLAVMRALQIV